MLHIIYILITLVLGVYIVRQLFTEGEWRKQVALAILLIPVILRVLHIK
ncbi:MAG: hypothetical protein LWX56_10115 [Ignavibacteria bacterium]|nr:hypothetical protein [Ignavibacteria bacterium]